MTELGNYIKEKRESKGLSKRALAEAAEISHTEIHRIENGERQNPSPPLLRSLATALGVQYGALMEKAGYINNLSEIFPQNIQEEYEERFIEILTPKLIKEGWVVESCSQSNISDILARKNDINWNFEFKYFNGSNISKHFNENHLFNTYGKLALYDKNKINKFTIVTNNTTAYNTYVNFVPVNLKMKITAMLIDFQSNKIVKEVDLN